MSKAIIHHHSGEFAAFYGEMRGKLRYLFQTEGMTLAAPGSGTYGVEMAIYSFFSAGDSVVVVSNGKFSTRWAAYLRSRNVFVEDLVIPWGEVPDPVRVAEACDRIQARGLVVTHCETSTAALLDLETIAWRAREACPDLLIVADTITTTGAVPMYADAWGIDVAVVASQKALMSPAGVVAYALSERALRYFTPSDAADFAHLANHVRAAANDRSPFTPPLTLFYAVDAALDLVAAEGLPAIWNRVHQAAHTFRDGFVALGGKVFGESPSDSLSAVYFEEKNLDGLREKLKSKHQITLSGGQDSLKGKIMRISHMGLTDARLMLAVLEAIKSEL